MNYEKIYNNLITSRILLKRVKNNDGLLEKHHIIPKCLGGILITVNLNRGLYARKTSYSNTQGFKNVSWQNCSAKWTCF